MIYSGGSMFIDLTISAHSLPDANSFTALNNKKSENVMKKIGMAKKGEFNHPELINHPEYEKHFCYEILRNNNEKI